jgi:hypothetical protein
VPNRWPLRRQLPCDVTRIRKFSSDKILIFSRIGISVRLSSHHNRFPGLGQSAGECPHPLSYTFTHRFAEHAKHIKACRLLIPGLTPTVLSLPPLPTPATKNRNLPIPIHLPSDRPPPTTSKPADLPVSSTCTRKWPRHCMALHGLFPMLVLLAPRAMRYV